MIRRSLVTATALALLIVGCGGSAGDSAPSDPTPSEPAPSEPAPSEPAPSAPDTATIAIEGFSFGQPVTVAVGGQVTVVNRDGVSHTWTSREGAFDSGPIGPDAEFTFSFDEPGDYEFFCSIHPTMEGTISVSS